MLEDGSYVSSSDDKSLKRWDERSGTVYTTFIGHLGYVHRVIELNRKVIVSASFDKTVRMWGVASGNCIRIMTLHTQRVCGLVKLEDGRFATGSSDRSVRVWDHKGDYIEEHQTECKVQAMIRRRTGSIVIGSGDQLEIRRFQFISSISSLLSIDTDVISM